MLISRPFVSPCHRLLGCRSAFTAMSSPIETTNWRKSSINSSTTRRRTEARKRRNSDAALVLVALVLVAFGLFVGLVLVVGFRLPDVVRVPTLKEGERVVRGQFLFKDGEWLSLPALLLRVRSRQLHVLKGQAVLVCGLDGLVIGRVSLQCFDVVFVDAADIDILRPLNLAHEVCGIRDRSGCDRPPPCDRLSFTGSRS
jgi:hypothetical protein